MPRSTDRDSDADAGVHSNARCQHNAFAYPHGSTEHHPELHAGCVGNGDGFDTSSTHADGNSKAVRICDRDRDVYCDAHTFSVGDPDEHCDAESLRNTASIHNADLVGHADSIADRERVADAEPLANTQSDRDSEFVGYTNAIGNRNSVRFPVAECNVLSVAITHGDADRIGDGNANEHGDGLGEPE